MIKRGSGVLLHVSSLPGEYGIGGFSREADKFLELIRGAGFCWWQVLPLSSIGAGNSPYSGVSAFALDYVFADPALLFEDGLITKEEADASKYGGEKYVADYGFAKRSKKEILEKAFARLDENQKAQMSFFKEKNRKWLEPYCLYSALKSLHGEKPWWEWEKKYAGYEKLDKASYVKEHGERLNFYAFEQYILHKQWERIRAVSKKCGTGVIGDLPIYVSLDSVDVWANPKQFQLDKDLKPKCVAGVPPDYFSEEGQLWGNPLYDYAEMEKDGFSWWIDRLSRSFDLYDAVRIDHFRGFGQYWSVPFDAETAKEGIWEDGPAMSLFSIVKKKFKDKLIIAEDLGVIDDKTREFLKQTGFPGMRVMQFAFTDLESTHLPHNYPINCVAYTATHDNDTTLGWLYKQPENVREYALKYVDCKAQNWGEGGGGCKSTAAVIRSLLASSALIAVVPMQDLCGYGSDTRMNIPGVPEGNWTYRATDEAFGVIDKQFLLDMNNLYGRNNVLTEKSKKHNREEPL